MYVHPSVPTFQIKPFSRENNARYWRDCGSGRVDHLFCFCIVTGVLLSLWILEITIKARVQSMIPLARPIVPASGRHNFHFLIHSANPKSQPVGIFVFAHVVRPYVRPHFSSLEKSNRKQHSLLAWLWVWPSGSLITPVLLSFVFRNFEEWRRMTCVKITIMITDRDCGLAEWINY